MIYLVLQYLRGILHEFNLRGQESPTLHDLLSVIVFKRDFARIRFLGVDVHSVWVVINVGAQVWNNYWHDPYPLLA
jgi:hypothetical protein